MRVFLFVLLILLLMHCPLPITSAVIAVPVAAPPPAAPPPAEPPAAPEVEQATKSADSAADVSTTVQEPLINIESTSQQLENTALSIENIIGQESPVPVEASAAGFNLALPSQALTPDYSSAYLPGTYRTVVIVYEGDVVVAPYDERGLQEAKAIPVVTGQTITQEKEIK